MSTGIRAHYSSTEGPKIAIISTSPSQLRQKGGYDDLAIQIRSANEKDRKRIFDALRGPFLHALKKPAAGGGHRPFANFHTTPCRDFSNFSLTSFAAPGDYLLVAPNHSQAASAGVTTADQVDPEAPLTLQAAAERAFPDGTMTVRTLRAERDRGRLETWIIGKREYTSLAAIEKMVDLCKAASRTASRERVASSPGAFDITKTPPAPDSALRSLERLKERLKQERAGRSRRGAP